MPCPHFDVKIIQRSKRQSAVASAAYQSGERLFSEYDQKQKYYSHKSEIVHTEIMLPPHAPPEYADRNALWNAAEAIEKQWNSQLARRFVLAIPRELPPEQYADLIRDYCREFFVSKGMIADFAIHDKGDGNPHAHILLTMRAMDETGKWLPKSRKVYDLDENGERIRLASGRWKSHKEDTVDWNDQKYATNIFSSIFIIKTSFILSMLRNKGVNRGGMGCSIPAPETPSKKPGISSLSGRQIVTAARPFLPHFPHAFPAFPAVSFGLAGVGTVGLTAFG